MGAFKGFGHGVGLDKTAAASGRVTPGDLLHSGHDLVPCRMGQNHLHAEAGHQSDNPLGHGERLAVRRTVGPGHGDLLAVEIFHPAKGVDQVQHIGHGLGGVVDVAL